MRVLLLLLFIGCLGCDLDVDTWTCVGEGVTAACGPAGTSGTCAAGTAVNLTTFCTDNTNYMTCCDMP